MATIKLGMNVTDMRGKAGQVVYSRNGSGQTARAWNYPRRQGNVKQIEKRSWLGTVRHAWGQLSQAQIDEWDALGASPPEVDYNRVGDVILLPGSAWHTRINMRLLQAGLSMSDVCPASVPVNAPISFSAVVYEYDNVVDESQANYTSGDFDGFYLVLKMSLVNSLVKQTCSTGYKSVYVGVAPYDSPVPIIALLQAVFPQLSVGQRLFVDVYKQSDVGIRSLKLSSITDVLE